MPASEILEHFHVTCRCSRHTTSANQSRWFRVCSEFLNNYQLEVVRGDEHDDLGMVSPCIDIVLKYLPKCKLGNLSVAFQTFTHVYFLSFRRDFAAALALFVGKYDKIQYIFSTVQI